jgi:hypothetical protein
MREHPDATILLRALGDEPGDDRFDPDSPYARASLERILAAAPEPARRRYPRRLALAAVPVGLAAVALAVVPALGGSRTAIAQAAVIQRAAAALEQAGTITYLQVEDYSAYGGGGCARAVLGIGCIAGSSPIAPGGISADPAQDTLTLSYQEWTSPDLSQDHITYANGDETVNNLGTQQIAAYDATDNTLTTLTDTGFGTAPQGTGAAAPLPLPAPANLADPSYYETLYQQALAGTQGVQLVGQTTIGSESVYELQFLIVPPTPADPPAGEECGGTVCVPPDLEIQVYLDSQTFTPVRSVQMTVNTTDRPGIPPGTTVNEVSDFSVQHLPDTPANASLLQMSAHPGATQVDETADQYRAQLENTLAAQIAANLARSGGGSAAASNASAERRAVSAGR